MVDNVREHGWHTFYVSDSVHPHHLPQDQGPVLNAATGHGFAYTVGLWPTRRHPEFVLTGTDVTDLKQAHGLLSGAVYRVIDDGAEFTAGDEDDRVLEHHPVRFGAVAELYRVEMLTWSHWAARRGDFEALQLIVPDANRIFPGNAGYEGPPQPLLDREPPR